MLATSNGAASSSDETRHNIALLLRLLGRPSSTEAALVPAIGWDWQPFASLCDYHQIASFIYCRLQNRPEISLPVELVDQLRLQFFEVSVRNYHLATKLLELTSLFEENEIRVMAYKGPTLAMIAYGDLALRQYSDLDLVIRQRDLAKAVALMTERGFEIDRNWWNPGRTADSRFVARHFEVAFQSPDKSYFVDLHWQLAPREARAFRLDIDQVWNKAESVKLLQSNVLTLCREDLFLALCCHGTRHRWSCLKWLLDIVELLRDADRWNWSRIEEITERWPFVRASASLAVALAHDLLGLDAPGHLEQLLPSNKRIRAVTAAIRDEIMSHGSSAMDNTALLTLQASPLERMRSLRVQTAWRLHQVFVEVSPKERALVALPERLEFLYHVLRPARLALKYGRKAVRRIF